MTLVQNSYGKGRVRVMRVARDGDRNEVSELTVLTLLTGDFGESYTAGDNRKVIATDTIKNITYIVARENMTACTELYGEALAKKYFERYPQVESVSASMRETKWIRASVGGQPHPHSFLLDANGFGFAEVTATPGKISVTSGVRGFTFMKTTQSGWVDYVMDDYTTLPETTDRIAATAMDASWKWASAPKDYPTANALVLSTMLEVFATTYSKGVQDSLFRMGTAALAAVPELETISMACPNKHYIPFNLSKFDMSSDNMIFTPTDEPHGQIECTIGRG